MECILFRRGTAVERDEWDGEESLRPLTTRGAEKTRDAAAGLLRMEVQPGYLWTSPLTRAFDTAKIIRQMLCPRLELQVQESLLPEAPPDKLLALLVSLPSDATVICVGHEPHLGETAGTFLFGCFGSDDEDIVVTPPPPPPLSGFALAPATMQQAASISAGAVDLFSQIALLFAGVAQNIPAPPVLGPVPRLPVPLGRERVVPAGSDPGQRDLERQRQ